MKISSNFDAGSIEIASLERFDDIQLNIRKDNASDFAQWFYFRLQGAAYQYCQMKFLNAGQSAYPAGWQDYQAMASYDRVNWFRVPTHYDGQVMIIEHTPLANSIYYAYFEPYSNEQHLNLIGQAQGSGLCQVTDLGSSVQSRDINLLTIGHEVESDLKVWIIARQHPGETMAEWLIEGLLSRLLDPQDPTSRALLDRATFYIVPNMNPDGSILGNLRTNAAGANLNREWLNPTAERSPEVLAVRNKMHETGVDLFLDIHGDEALPYVFVAGNEGIPNYSPRLAELEENFKHHLLLASPDFQDEHGYAKKEAGQADLSMATAYVGNQFDCLAYTLEMPFKDNANLPDDDYGWNGQRSLRLGEALLTPIYAVLNQLR
ncbi:M14-type cytosolic carboxypeptidase [Crenobacter sp. SG2305]|uniref:M14 family metallopeptidase n=1 Tax=Crenobacter oryzisoli TaxID=3056844 RepID=UPI0025AA7978|nr:M14-type cytosolic carboxypeptidase [Crenobacter sp. SG2305]MDN0085408.1 M14-type cytosolic carboxypeptidase [Crenobacter sp. SG2305]